MTTTNNKPVGRAALLGSCKRRLYSFAVDGLGTVRIQSLSEREKSAFEMRALNTDGKLNPKGLEEARRRLIALCVVDENGTRLLTNADLPKLEQVDGAITTRLYDACRRHCGFEDGDIEGLVKNSSTTTDAGSPTG